MSHGDHVSEIAPGFKVYGTSPHAPFAITADLERNFYAVQFHPEVHHTPNGKTLYENFVRLAGFAQRLDHGCLPRADGREDPRRGGR